MKLLIIDNYDSFTYNIVHACRELGVDPVILRNDKFHIADIAPFDKIILSPGPGLPSEAGLMPAVIKAYADKKPMLGVCLGHQAIAEAFGATLTNLDEVFHGRQTPVDIIATDYLFETLPSSFPVGRYHSWVVDRESVPYCLEVTAVDANGQVMAIRHRSLDIHGLQFHPESIMTPDGLKIISNFLKK